MTLRNGIISHQIKSSKGLDCCESHLFLEADTIQALMSTRQVLIDFLSVLHKWTHQLLENELFVQEIDEANLCVLCDVDVFSIHVGT